MFTVFSYVAPIMGRVVKETVKSFRNGGTLYDISIYPCMCK